MRKLLGLFTLYFHTIRYLRPIQLFGRLKYRFHRLKLDVPPGTHIQCRAISTQLITHSWLNQRYFGLERAVFLNEEGGLSGWCDPGKSLLWNYNLHYFDDLLSANAKERVPQLTSIMDDWIIKNPAGKGVGWDPYPTSLRVVNWVKWFIAVRAPSVEQLASLWLQAYVLSQKLEYHLMGNHLFANAKALVFAGMYFSGSHAEKWLKAGSSILKTELCEQVLEDGGHYERSPMYHAAMTADVLDILSLLRSFGLPNEHDLVQALEKRISPMLSWAGVMSHPDGDVSFFNDSAKGVSPDVSTLSEYASKLSGVEGCAEIATPKTPRVVLAESGYVRLNLDDAVVFLDVAMIGPDYIPGHAHADTLSMELSAFGQRFIVNSGTSCYGLSDERLRQRGTAAHSTVVIDGGDSSEVWSGFRVARRARPIGLSFSEQDDIQHGGVECSHNGYQRRPYKCTHTRSWQYSPRSLVVVDRVSGKYKAAEARFHIAPEWSLELDGNELRCRAVSGDQACITVKRGMPRLEVSSYHPQFGLSIESQVLVINFDANMTEVEVSW